MNYPGDTRGARRSRALPAAAAFEAWRTQPGQDDELLDVVAASAWSS